MPMPAQLAVDGDGRGRQDARVYGMIQFFQDIDLTPLYRIATQFSGERAQHLFGMAALAATG